MSWWLKFRLRIARWLLQKSNDWTWKLLAEAGVTVKWIDLTQKISSSEESRKFRVCCPVCTHEFSVSETDFLPDVECPNCGTADPMVVEGK